MNSKVVDLKDRKKRKQLEIASKGDDAVLDRMTNGIVLMELMAKNLEEHHSTDLYCLCEDKTNKEMWLGDWPKEGVDVLFSHTNPLFVAAAMVFQMLISAEKGESCA